MTNPLERIRAAREVIEQVQAELVKDGRASMRELFRTVFDAHPEIAAFRWRQYTPYFNDGEPCRFGRYEVEAQLANSEDESFSEDWSYKDPRHAIVKPGLTKFEGVLTALGKELCEQIFGDPARVTVTRDGIEIEEFDHE